MAQDATSTIEVPVDVALWVRAEAFRRGTTTEEVVTEVWDEYFESHRDELRQELERVAYAIRSRKAPRILAALLSPGGASVLSKLYPPPASA